jgi:hypothetical protein
MSDDRRREARAYSETIENAIRETLKPHQPDSLLVGYVLTVMLAHPDGGHVYGHLQLDGQNLATTIGLYALGQRNALSEPGEDVS